jgi:chromatin remodeling complex protein RSC6
MNLMHCFASISCLLDVQDTEKVDQDVKEKGKRVKEDGKKKGEEIKDEGKKKAKEVKGEVKKAGDKVKATCEDDDTKTKKKVRRMISISPLLAPLIPDCSRLSHTRLHTACPLPATICINTTRCRL